MCTYVVRIYSYKQTDTDGRTEREARETVVMMREHIELLEHQHSRRVSMLFLGHRIVTSKRDLR